MNPQGTWYNELGSSMTLAVNGGVVSGQYQTAVGSAQGTYALAGLLDTAPAGASQAIGFTVAWVNQYGSSGSVTAWSGQLQILNGQLAIVTTWLLTTETDPANDWASTTVGQDVFTQTQPTNAQIEARLKKGHVSHPHPSKFKPAKK